jgi:upstream activation factor subunit UAF30
MEAMTTDDKLELVIKDLDTLMETSKSLSARMKVFHKEALKSQRKKARKVEVNVDVDPDAPKPIASINKPVVISNELCKFLGFPPDTEHSRNEVTTSINKYVKDHDLQDPANKRYIRLEGSPEADKLKVLLRNPDQPLTFFNIQRYLKPHYPMSAKDKKALADSTSVHVSPPVVTSVDIPLVSRSVPIVDSASKVVPDSASKVVPDSATVEDASQELGKSTFRKKVRKI